MRLIQFIAIRSYLDDRYCDPYPIYLHPSSVRALLKIVHLNLIARSARQGFLLCCEDVALVPTYVLRGHILSKFHI